MKSYIKRLFAKTPPTWEPQGSASYREAVVRLWCHGHRIRRAAWSDQYLIGFNLRHHDIHLRGKFPRTVDHYPPGHGLLLIRTSNLFVDYEIEMRRGWWLAAEDDRMADDWQVVGYLAGINTSGSAS